MLLKCLSLFAVISSILGFDCGLRKVSQPASLIRGGTNSYPGQWSWLVSLHKRNSQHKFEYFCSASLINEKTLVTAAHCISETLNDRIIAILGRHDISNDTESNWVWREITERIVHDDYKHDDESHIKSEADIAILIMDHQIEFTNFIQPICLPNVNENVFKVPGIVAGYGQPDPFQKHLKKPVHAALKSVDFVDCLYSQRHSLQVVSKRSFCAGNNQSVPCYGDSGSGFNSRVNGKWTLLGVTSHGFDSECSVDNLVIFVNVPKFVEWIEEKKWKGKVEKRVDSSTIRNSLSVMENCDVNDPYCSRYKAPKYECGHLLPMNVNNNPNNPKTPGFNSGTYKDGSTVFPGTGNFPSCPGVNPARVTTSNSDRGPGAYLGCNSHLFDKNDAFYYVQHPKMKWIPTNTDDAEDVEGAIKVFFAKNDFDYVARINLTDGHRAYQQIGYFYHEDNVCYWDGNYSCRTGDFEILACVP